MNAQRQPLTAGRWHFHHGPIDIVIGAEGDPDAVHAAHQSAWHRFSGVLQELVAELPTLRQPVTGMRCPATGPIAQRMWNACHPHRDQFITPMAAVAGAVAEELIASYAQEGIRRAWVNNGGDIALHLEPGSSVRIGLYADLAGLELDATIGGFELDGAFAVDYALPVRGVATSGWRGRSFSLGIADSVTVLAQTAAQADASATIIANAVNLDHPGILRRAACDLKDDSDLGDRLVTCAVPELEDADAQMALLAGIRRAAELRSAGLIWSAVLVCQGWYATDRSWRVHRGLGRAVSDARGRSCNIPALAA